MDRFTLRGKKKVNAQWQLFSLVHNIEKIASVGAAASHDDERTGHTSPWRYFCCLRNGIHVTDYGTRHQQENLSSKSGSSTGSLGGKFNEDNEIIGTFSPTDSALYLSTINWVR